MFQPIAKIIADSINPWGTRLTTYELTYHRMIHSEILTHRVFSRNSSSSRAIPAQRMLRLVEEQEVYPLYWGKNQSGMSAKEEISDIEQARKIWGEARQDAIRHAKRLATIDAHKQVVNRLLEPFSTITVILSGTEFKNFFEQRCDENAQPEIQAIAYKMKDAYKASKPKECEVGQWHIPFIDPVIDKALDPETVLNVAVGRCARVSYLTHDGIRDPKEDVRLCDRLWNSRPQHLSPFEHVARVAPRYTKNDNFEEWASLRHQLRVGALVFENGKISGGRRAN